METLLQTPLVATGWLSDVIGRLLLEALWGPAPPSRDSWTPSHACANRDGLSNQEEQDAEEEDQE